MLTVRPIRCGRIRECLRQTDVSRTDVAIAALRQKVAPFDSREVAVCNAAGLRPPRCRVDAPDDADARGKHRDHLLAVRDERSPPARSDAPEWRADERARGES